MIGDMFNNNKRRDVVTRVDQVMRFGKKWKQEASGYYVCTTTDDRGNRRRLHVEVWQRHYGVRVPPGCIIHHLDWNKNNNTVDNLICLTVSEHERVHNIVGGEKGKALGYEMVKTRVDGLPPDVI